MLKVKKSRIPRSGKGLFTTSPIRKGDIVVEYKGIKTTWKECVKRDRNRPQQAPYLYYVSPNNCIDAEFTTEELARYANDANGFTKIKGLKNNCEYINIKGVPYIIAVKNIPAGSEIYVDYTDDYWDAMKEEEEKVSKKSKK